LIATASHKVMVTMQNKNPDARQSQLSTNMMPTPPYPQKRREPLPWQVPKSAEDDLDAPSRARPSWRVRVIARPIRMWRFKARIH